MEVVEGTHKASQFAPDKDYISGMPGIVISNILDRLPIQEAVSTGILYKDWRYKWTMLTQLVFGWGFCDFVEETGNHILYEKIVSRLLLHIKGAITKFVLCIDEQFYSMMDVEEITSWILFLTKYGLKEFTLINYGEPAIRLTSHLFSCLALTHLELENCHLHPTSEFHGFPNLLSLDLNLVVFEQSYTCGEFLTRCPNIKNLTLDFYTTVREIATVQSLKLREFIVSFSDCELLADANRNVPLALPCLKILKLWKIDFGSEIMVSFAFKLICGSPDLHTLQIVAVCKDAVLPGPSEIDYSRMGQLQLQEVLLYCIRGLENEECLIKSLLACSPFLKKMTIYFKIPEVCGDGSGGNGFAEGMVLLK